MEVTSLLDLCLDEVSFPIVLLNGGTFKYWCLIGTAPSLDRF